MAECRGSNCPGIIVLRPVRQLPASLFDFFNFFHFLDFFGGFLATRLCTLDSAQLRDTERRPHLVLDLARQFRPLFQEIARIVLTLADTFAVIAVPGTGFFDDFRFRTEVENFAFA